MITPDSGTHDVPYVLEHYQINDALFSNHNPTSIKILVVTEKYLNIPSTGMLKASMNISPRAMVHWLIRHGDYLVPYSPWNLPRYSYTHQYLEHWLGFGHRKSMVMVRQSYRVVASIVLDLCLR